VGRSDRKEAGINAFFLKSNKKLFVLGSIGFAEAPKSPERALPALFKPYSETDWAVIYAGDLKTSVRSGAFKEVRKWDFKAALGAPSAVSGGKKAKGHDRIKRSLDNFWFKNLALVSARNINLYEEFADLGADVIRAEITDSFPIRAEFSFSPDAGDGGIQTQMLSKSRRGPASTVAGSKAPRIASYPPPLSTSQLSSLQEDIESEESAVEPAAKSKTPVRRKKHGRRK
jgi:hypothetical protein